MKLLALVLATALTGCTTMADPTVLVDAAGNIVTGLTSEATNKQGLTSRDATYLQAYKQYSKSKSEQKERKYVEIKAAPGKTIENLESITVYAPPAPGETTINAPVPQDSNLVAGIKAGTEGAAKVLGALLPFEIVAKGTEVIKDKNATDLQAEAIRNETTQQAIDKEPLVVRPEVILVPQ